MTARLKAAIGGPPVPSHGLAWVTLTPEPIVEADPNQILRVTHALLGGAQQKRIGFAIVLPAPLAREKLPPPLVVFF